ncbi:serine/threonine protein phosphatase [Pedobacter lusitanus]|uniref:Serine/threonine protein phosphatase n=1 Tax=Pedobacter lusitanus TaxID=1503925 RepID=A0A0D0GN64_9SPHI|nr:metallophosphoesterase family protein [Pedobacter lusitanus]KIO77630.1 serine/threonine protein phosphatase [Pedobacter lusitanus]
MSLIAIFSDVHGNLPALQAVLNDIEKRKADQIYCLGDLVDFAPWTNEVIEIVKGLQISCLMGNHDERIAFNHEIIPLGKHTKEETKARITAINYTKNTIREENRKYLAGLPAQISITFKLRKNQITMLLVHGSTRSNEEYIYEDHDPNDIDEMLTSHQADILVMGHTHLSYIRTIPSKNNDSDQVVINCGSVGRSKEGKPLATYLLIAISEDGIKPELIKLEYPVNKVISGIQESGIPDFYASFLMD